MNRCLLKYAPCVILSIQAHRRLSTPLAVLTVSARSMAEKVLRKQKAQLLKQTTKSLKTANNLDKTINYSESRCWTACYLLMELSGALRLAPAYYLFYILKYVMGLRYGLCLAGYFQGYIAIY